MVDVTTSAFRYIVSDTVDPSVAPQAASDGTGCLAIGISAVAANGGIAMGAGDASGQDSFAFGGGASTNYAHTYIMGQGSINFTGLDPDLNTSRSGIFGGHDQSIVDSAGSCILAGDFNTINVAYDSFSGYFNSEGSAIIGGNNNLLSGAGQTVIVGGFGNTATCGYSVILGGFFNTIGINTTVLPFNLPGGSATIGNFNTITGDQAIAINGANLNGFGCVSQGVPDNTICAASQHTTYNLYRENTGTDPVLLGIYSGNPDAFCFIFPGTVAWMEATVIGRNNGGACSIIKFSGVLKNILGSFTITNPTKTVVYQDDPTWDTNLTLDTVNFELDFTATAGVTPNVRWIGNVRVLEMLNDPNGVF